jgi:hypothetical protein
VFGAYYLLTLGTIFMMLEANLSDESIVAELMLQRNLWVTEAQLDPPAFASTNPLDPRNSINRAYTLSKVNEITDWLVARAQVNHPANPAHLVNIAGLGSLAGLSALVHPAPIVSPHVINVSKLGSLSGLTQVAQNQWVKYYLSLGKKP